MHAIEIVDEQGNGRRIVAKTIRVSKIVEAIEWAEELATSPMVGKREVNISLEVLISAATGGFGESELEGVDW